MRYFVDLYARTSDPTGWASGKELVGLVELSALGARHARRRARKLALGGKRPVRPYRIDVQRATVRQMLRHGWRDVRAKRSPFAAARPW